MIHTLSTCPGHSGAPIIRIREEGKLTIVGIHKGERRYQGDNGGRLMTP